MRSIFNLDPNWKFQRGDQQTTLKSHASVYQAAKAGSQPGPAAKSMFDDSGWEKVDLPHDYLTKAPFSPDAIGNHGYRVFENAWYRKCFRVDAALAGSHALLVFDGIATSSEIFFNGSLIRRSFSAYNEIVIDVTDRIYYDRINTLAVHTRADGIDGWWYEGAGIYRHVHLLFKPIVHIAHNGIYAKPTPQSDGTWRVPVEVTLENSGFETAETTVRASLADGADVVASSECVTAVCPADGKTAVMLEMTVRDPHLWDVDDPHLYTVSAEIGDGADLDDVTVGFRTFRLDAAHGFFLNGRNLKIKGTCNHQDHAGVGVAVPDSIQEYRVRRLKEMGCNAYRCAHNPPAREILDACDRLGLIVMDENRDFEASAEALANLETLVRRDRNHPCVIFWSLFNEESLQNTEEGRAIFKRLKSVVRKLDDRPVLGAVNDIIRSGGTGDEMDVLGINYGIRRLDAIHEKYPQKPIIGSENNSAVTTRGCYESDRENGHVLNNYDEEIVPWGSTVRNMWNYARQHEWFGGIFIWTGFDYRGEPTPFEWPSVSSQFGVLDTCGFPKDAYYFTQAVWRTEPMIHLLPHWNHETGKTVRVMTVSNCEEVELFLNGVSLGRRKNDICEQNEWAVPFAAGTLAAIGYQDGVAAAKAERKTARKAVAVRLAADRTTLHDAGGDTVPVRVSVVDECGIELPNDDRLIRFFVEGDGINAGVGNGDPNSHEADQADERKLYHGLCQILVAAKIGANKIKLRAEADGLKPAEISFTIEKKPRPAYLYFTENRSINEIRASVRDAEEKPDPKHVYADNDMNSLAPVVLVSKFNAFQPTQFRSGWRELRIAVSLPADLPLDKAGIEFGSAVADRVECYVDGNCIFETGKIELKPLVVPLKKAGKERFELCLLVHALNTPGISSGFTQGASLIEI